MHGAAAVSLPAARRCTLVGGLFVDPRHPPAPRGPRRHAAPDVGRSTTIIPPLRRDRFPVLVGGPPSQRPNRDTARFNKNSPQAGRCARPAVVSPCPVQLRPAGPNTAAKANRLLECGVPRPGSRNCRWMNGCRIRSRLGCRPAGGHPGDSPHVPPGWRRSAAVKAPGSTRRTNCPMWTSTAGRTPGAAAAPIRWHRTTRHTGSDARGAGRSVRNWKLKRNTTPRPGPLRSHHYRRGSHRTASDNMPGQRHCGRTVFRTRRAIDLAVLSEKSLVSSGDKSTFVNCSCRTRDA